MDYYDAMTKQRREAIYSFAEKIREILCPDPIVDLHAMTVDSLGGKVYEKRLDDDISGKIKKAGESFEITLNSGHSHYRKNFTMAHELGHLFLHMGYLTDEEKWNAIDEYIDSPYYRIGYSEEEYEANHFAGALLMPEKKYKAFVKENTDEDGLIDIPKISKHFDVSDDAALTRGKWLGVFRWD